ncbi:MAG: glycosyltransferase family 9 protein [Candidatus Kapaibacterium sp.]|nr:glycosyltransferase family 9 protein [Ignavibacteriota bacterium]MCB9222079.1 glycosyltransferase family 9 protein [Ignavibacteria bacterium]
MKILVIRLGRIGDMILSTPLLYQLKNSSENIIVDVLASNDNHSILKYADYVDNVYIWNKNPFKLIPLIMRLRKMNYDVILEPKDHFSTESYFIAGLVKAEKRIGFVNGESSIFDVDVSVFNQDKTHFQDRILSTLKALDITPDYSLNIPLMYLNYKADMQNVREEYIIVNISASNESKSLQFDLAKEILVYLKSKNIKVYLLSAPNHNDLAQKLSEITNIERAITKSIIDTFPIIHRAKGVITADTSVVHIAGTYDTPVMVLSKSIEQELLKFAPKSDINLVLKSNSGERIEISKTKLIDSIDKFLEII